MLKVLKWLLIGFVLLVVLVVAVAALAAYQLANTVADDKPMTIPVVTVLPQTRTVLLPRYNCFADALNNHCGTEVSFTGDDINQLIAVVPELEELRGKVLVRLEGDYAFVTTSIPLQEVSSQLEGRYLNGEFKLLPSYQNGNLNLKVLSAKNARGEAYPDWILETVNTLLIKAQDVEEAQEPLAKLRDALETLFIKDGEVRLVTRCQN